MEWQCKQEIEDALWLAAQKRLRKASLERKTLVRAIADRTLLYTTGRQELANVARSSSTEADLAARALFFTIADAAKISIPLNELEGRELLPKGKSWKVLDLGAGAGAMGLGLLSFASTNVPGLSVAIDAVDLDDDALAIYSDALSGLDKNKLGLGEISMRITRSSTANYLIKEGHYDLVVLGSVLNELSAKDRSDLAVRAMQGVNSEGALIIVEPALRETSRGLHEVRDALLESGAQVFAPCTRKLAPCPALSDSRDWCHEDRAVVLPTRTRQISQATGLRDGGLKFSYLVMRHQAASLIESVAGAVALRVVGQPQRGKGQKECFVCGDFGRSRLRLLKRERTSENRVFDRCRRGDVLSIESFEVENTERIDLRKGQKVERHQPTEKD